MPPAGTTVPAEDAPLYPALQRGMQSNPFRGTISIREELLFAFQDDVRRRYHLPVVETETDSDPVRRAR